MRAQQLIWLWLFPFCISFAQHPLIKGQVKESRSFEPIADVIVTIEGTGLSTQTNILGEFQFTYHIPFGEQILKISKADYITKRYPIVVSENETVNMTDITMDVDVSLRELFTITLTDDELNDDTGGADNVSGLLTSSLDVFQKTAAFEWSSSFFRARGLDSKYATVLINGLEMNKVYTGRPEWSNWSGLNDVMRNQELSWGLAPADYNFGGLLGTTNIDVRASQAKPGGRITYSYSNRSYTNRVMATYASGLLKSNWAFTVALGKRYGNEGYQEATLYHANSFFASIEKKINAKHSLNFTSIYVPSRRGKSSPNTQEVYNLKDIKYNEYWGYLEGKQRNSRIKKIDEPIIMLNHYWDISKKTTLNINIGYQFGTLGNSRLDYPGGANPNPAYYQKLPSYALSDPKGPDYASAYQLEQQFIEDGQISWERILDANVTNNIGNLSAAYALYEDRVDDKQLTLNSILSSEINEHILLNTSISYKTLKSANFAEIIDLLGSQVGVINVDTFDNYQYDVKNPNRLLGEGEKYRYNYNLYAGVISGYTQGRFQYNRVDFYLSASVTNTKYQREGLWEHSRFAGAQSYGKGKALSFTGIGTKTGLTYKITGKHILDINAGYRTKAPLLRNVFSNPRENHNIVKHIDKEKIMAIDASYIYRSPIVKAKLTEYYITIKDANEVGFYFADGLSGSENIQDNQTSAFVQEILQGVNKKQFGVELGVEAQITPTINIKGAASIGQFTYDNNPDLYLTSSSFTAPDGSISYGKANLKNYKIAGGPQRAYSVGFDYRDPDYWWFGATANFFTNAYLDINTLTRTENFYLDADGLPFNDYDPELARALLKQEKFDGYMVVNLVGGKSWKIGTKYLGVFASINNLLDKAYKTGGFEQGRSANYRELRDDNANPKRVFGPKYWYGRGTTYFVNVNLRF